MLEAMSALVIWLLIVVVAVQMLFLNYLTQRLQGQRRYTAKLEKQVEDLTLDLDDSALIIAQQRDRIQLHVMRELAHGLMLIHLN